MGNCFGGVKEVRKYELKFMSLCQEGTFGNKDTLVDLLEAAKNDGQEDQIFGAHDDVGDLPIHKACESGNPTVLEWILETWANKGLDINIDEPNAEGLSPLYLVCYKGYQGQESVAKSNPETQEKRMTIAKILLQRNADVNWRSPLLNMTPLHWLAYQGDAEMV